MPFQNFGVLLSDRHHSSMNTVTCISFKPYVIVLHPRLRGNAWGLLLDRLTHDAITHIDLSALSREFIRE